MGDRAPFMHVQIGDVQPGLFRSDDMRPIAKSSQFFSSLDAALLHIAHRDFDEIILDAPEIRHRNYFFVGSPDSRRFFGRQISFDHGGFFRTSNQRMPKLHLFQFAQDGTTCPILQ